MDFIARLRTTFIKSILGLTITIFLLAGAAFALDSDDSQTFIAGFNAYQKKDYPKAIEDMKTVLKKYPDSPLRDMALFWLARASYKAGDAPAAAKTMSQFFREYPDSPLKTTVEEDLTKLVARYDRGETIPAATAVAAAPKQPAQSVAAAEAALKAAAAKAEAERAAAEKVAVAKAEAERLAAEKAAGTKAEADRIAAEQALKAAAVKAEAERAAAEKAAVARAEAERLAAEKAAVAKAEADRVAAEKIASAKAEADRRAAEQALQAAAAKAEAERAAAEKVAVAKAEADRTAAEQALKVAAAAAAADRIAFEKAAAAKEEAERLAAEQAQKMAVARAEADRTAAEQAQKMAIARADAERNSAARAAADRLAAEKAARAQAAATEKVAATPRPAEETTAFSKLMAEKEAALKAIEEQERLDRQGAAVAAAATPAPMAAPAPVAAPVPAPVPAPTIVATQTTPAPAPAAPRVEERRPAPAAVPAAPAPRVASASAAAYREKAIAEYKSVIQRFPGTRAAADAEQRLKGMGVALPAPDQQAVAAATTQVLNLEVGQFANVDFSVLPVGDTLESGKRYTIPFEAINRGNGDDRFEFVSGFPAEYNVHFAAAAAPDAPISVTPAIAPGEKFKGIIALTIPKANIDGQRSLFPVKLVSQVSGDASQSREVSLVASAPLMRAVIKSDKGMVPPGGRVSYRIALLNVGTAAARGVTLRLNYPPQYEPVEMSGAAFARESETALTLADLKVNSGESRDYTVVFRVKDEAIARQELFCRADVVNADLDTSDSFLSTVAYVETISGVAARTAASRLVVIPGQTVTVPIVVTNSGNAMDSFTIRPAVAGDLSYSFYRDLNRDGMRQANEPAVTRIGPLAPKEEAYLLMEIATPASAVDRTTASVSVALEPDSNQAKRATVATVLAFSRPLIEMSLTGKGGRIKPGEVVSVDLTAVNNGSNLAKVVEILTSIPGDLEVIASDPPYIRGNGGEYVWTFEELGAGEKRNIRMSFRVKAGVAMGTAIQVKNVLNYRDQLGNRY